MSENTTKNDLRHLLTGRRIGPPHDGYSDQPYCVVNNDGSWTCVMTVGGGREGQPGQHVVSTLSEDGGRTWSDFARIEPPDGPEASWAQPLLIPETGRIYVFYTYNRDNLREVKREDGKVVTRVDSLGTYMYRYSDDRGLSWSGERYEIPMRLFRIDRENIYGGRVLFLWGVGKPFLHEGEAFVPYSKVGAFGDGFFTRNEGAILASPNLATEPDPAKHEWITLPEGEEGVRAPEGAGPISGEFYVTPMNDGSFFGTFRTLDGYACQAYSRDRGRSWTTDWMRYAPEGRAVKNPRSANFAWRCSNGKYLYWFNNHGGAPLGEACREPGCGSRGYAHRNPTFLLGGIERDGLIHWSEPEIALYHDNIGTRWSYPDRIEQDGRIYLTETEKHVARVHELGDDLLDALWSHDRPPEIANEGLVLEAAGGESPAMPELAQLCQPGGAGTKIDPDTGATVEAETGEFHIDRGAATFEFVLRFDALRPWQMIFDSRNEEGRGVTLMLTDRGALRLSLGGRIVAAPAAKWVNGLAESAWESDAGGIEPGRAHHVAFIVDGGPKTVLVVRDGILEDGGDRRQFGWGRFHPNLKELNGAENARIAPDMDGAVERFRLYDRALKVNQAVAHARAFGCAAT